MTPYPWASCDAAPLRFPPYPGNAHRYPESREVDHRALVNRLVSEFPHGWALSTGSNNLHELMPMMPADVRVAAWVKPFAVFKPNVNPAYAWEPVFFMGGRKRGRDVPTVVDWMACSITLRKGLVGAKPEAFCNWILDLLGFEPGDTVEDVFPGTGIMGSIVRARSTQYACDFEQGGQPE
jgi:hypothetical protein